MRAQWPSACMRVTWPIVFSLRLVCAQTATPRSEVHGCMKLFEALRACTVEKDSGALARRGRDDGSAGCESASMWQGLREPKRGVSGTSYLGRRGSCGGTPQSGRAMHRARPSIPVVRVPLGLLAAGSFQGPSRIRHLHDPTDGRASQQEAQRGPSPLPPCLPPTVASEDSTNSAMEQGLGGHGPEINGARSSAWGSASAGGSARSSGRDRAMRGARRAVGRGHWA